jgi:hypothetical protein
MYSNAKGPLKDITFEEIDALAHTAYRRYMCNDAFEDVQEHFPRDPEIHGPVVAAEDGPLPAPVPAETGGEEEGQS